MSEKNKSKHNFFKEHNLLGKNEINAQTAVKYKSLHVVYEVTGF